MVTTLAVALAVFCAVQLACLPEADAFESLSLRSLTIDAKNFFPGGQDPLITGNGIGNRTLGQELNLIIQADVVKYLYWDSTVHSATDRVLNLDGTTSPGQFRMVGLEMGLGVDFRRLFPWLPVRLGLHHWSKHALDTTYPWHFPVQDGVQLQIILYEHER